MRPLALPMKLGAKPMSALALATKSVTALWHGCSMGATPVALQGLHPLNHSPPEG